MYIYTTQVHIILQWVGGRLVLTAWADSTSKMIEHSYVLVNQPMLNILLNFVVHYTVGSFTHVLLAVTVTCISTMHDWVSPYTGTYQFSL